jgi:hypothetical protein
MKKLFIVLAIATAFASCNDDKATSSTTETATTEVVAPTTVEVAPVATDAPTTTATTAH